MAVTVYTPGAALNTDDFNTDLNFRVFVKMTAASNGQIRVRFKASTAAALGILGASFGKWNGVTLSGSSSDMTTPAFRLTFAGSNTGTVAANGTLTSDLITHTGLTLAANDWLIVTFFNTSAGGQRFVNGQTTATSMFKGTSTDYSQAQTAAAMGNGLTLTGSAQPGGATGINFCIDLVQTNDAATAYSLTTVAGNYTLTGTPVTLTKASNNKTIVAAAGGYTLTGTPVTLTKITLVNKTIAAAAGSYTFTGTSATMSKDVAPAQLTFDGGATQFSVTYTDNQVLSLPMTVAAAAGMERLVLVGSRSALATADFDACTIDGQAATRVGTISRGVGSGSRVFLTAYRAAGTANTAINVALTANVPGSSGSGVWGACWKMSYAGTVLAQTSTSTNDPTLSVNAAARGAVASAVIGFGSGAFTGGNVFTWTGLTERYEFNTLSNLAFSAAGDAFATASTPLAISVNITPDLTAGDTSKAGLALSFKPLIVNSIIALTGSYTLTGTEATPVKLGLAAPPVFRAASNTSYAERGNLTVADKPTGTLDGDIMLAGVFAFTSSANPADVGITAPAGWTKVGTEAVTGYDGTSSKFYVFWKRALSESGNYTFTHSGLNVNAVTQVVIVAYSGGLASGNPVDVYSSSQSTGVASESVATYTGVTTTGANEKLVLLGHNWTATQTLDPPTGMTERYDHVTYAADETIAVAGATGTRSHTVNVPPAAWAGFLVALKPGIASPAYSVVAEAGSYAFTGTPVTLSKTDSPYKSLLAASGTYALAGTPATLLLLSTGSPVFRSIASTTYDSRTGTTTIAKPTATADGDIMVATFFGGATVAANIVIDTVPAGWTQIGSTATVNESGAFFGKLWVWWKRASSEPASYNFLHANTLSTQVSVASYSGCIPSGNPVDAYSQAANNASATATAPSVTTTRPNTKLIYTGHNWSGTGTLDPPTGMTERFDSLLYYADESRTLAGATGDRSQTLTEITTWQAYLVALKGGGVVATAYSVTAVSGSYVLTGTTVVNARGLIAIAGSYAFNGSTVGLTVNGKRVLAHVAGNYVLSGSPVGIIVPVVPPSIPSGMSVWNGSAWVDKPVKVWTGSNWVEKPVKVWNGSTWN